MRRVETERKDDYYNETLSSIDEQICALIKERIELTVQPGMPTTKYISNWTERYGLEEMLLDAIFSTLGTFKEFKPQVEPKGYKGFMKVLKTEELDDTFYTITFIRQYENASIVYLVTDWDEEKNPKEDFIPHSFPELDLGEKYECRYESGTGSLGQTTNKYIVSPTLPDNITGLSFVFREYENYYKVGPPVKEVVINA